MDPDRCPNCGAPLGEASRTAAGLRCTYCDALVPVGAPPAGARAGAPSAAEPEAPALLFTPPVQRGLRALFALGLGWWTVLLGFLVVRSGYGDIEPPIAGIATGLTVLLWAGLLGGRLPGGAYAFAVGVALVLKPLVAPIRREEFTYSYDSETHLGYSIPGAVLVGLAALLLLTLKTDAVRGRLRELRPTLLGALCLAAGATFGVVLHSGETGDELYARFRPAYTARLEQVRGLAARLEAAEVPARVTNLDPAPVLIDNDERRSNCEALTLARLADLEDDADEYWLSGPLLQGLRRTQGTSWIGRRTGWKASDWEARDLERGLAQRYLVLYRRHPEHDGLEAWLLDLQRDAVVVRVERSGVNLEYLVGRATLLELLQEATGGTFRKR